MTGSTTLPVLVPRTHRSLHVPHLDSDGCGTNQILDFFIVHVHNAGNSQRMKACAFLKVLNMLIDVGVIADSITTARHKQIKKTLRENYPHILHQFDVWHFSANVKKHLWQKGSTERLWHFKARDKIDNKSLFVVLWKKWATSKGKLDKYIEPYLKSSLHCSPFPQNSTTIRTITFSQLLGMYKNNLTSS